MVDYSKWDKFDLSSDSDDIEVSPYVDRQSFLKWRREAKEIKRAEAEAKRQKAAEAASSEDPKVESVAEKVHIPVKFEVKEVPQAKRPKKKAENHSPVMSAEEFATALSKAAQEDFGAIYNLFTTCPQHVNDDTLQKMFLMAFESLYKGETPTGSPKRENVLLMRQCVFAAMILKYSLALGGDGTNLFFARMRSEDRSHRQVFMTDYEQHCSHVLQRGEVIMTKKETNEKYEAQQRVLKSMPQDMQDAIDTGDLGVLKEVMDKLPPEEADMWTTKMFEVDLLGAPDEPIPTPGSTAANGKQEA